jgi:hypothetical protein
VQISTPLKGSALTSIKHSTKRVHVRIEQYDGGAVGAGAGGVQKTHPPLPTERFQFGLLFGIRFIKLSNHI